MRNMNTCWGFNDLFHFFFYFCTRILDTSVKQRGIHIYVENTRCMNIRFKDITLNGLKPKLIIFSMKFNDNSITVQWKCWQYVLLWRLLGCIQEWEVMFFYLKGKCSRILIADIYPNFNNYRLKIIVIKWKIESKYKNSI